MNAFEFPIFGLLAILLVSIFMAFGTPVGRWIGVGFTLTLYLIGAYLNAMNNRRVPTRAESKFY